jgi:molybdopterin converting factor small subunit
MPQVKVGLYAGLRQYVAGAPSLDVEISPGQTVAQVLQALGVPREKAHIVFVNSRAAGMDYPLQGGEQVSVFPAVGGG